MPMSLFLLKLQNKKQLLMHKEAEKTRELEGKLMPSLQNGS
jgi:hypothetical protein